MILWILCTLLLWGRRSGSICWFDVPCNPACILPWGLTICFPTFWNLAERLNSTPTQKQAVSVLRLGSTRILPNVFACVSLFSIWLCILWETNKETYKYLWWHKRPNMLNGKRQKYTHEKKISTKRNQRLKQNAKAGKQTKWHGFSIFATLSEPAKF
jgi:hypothetical protein